jgi:hypothetical protein
VVGQEAVDDGRQMEGAAICFHLAQDEEVVVFFAEDGDLVCAAVVHVVVVAADVFGSLGGHMAVSRVEEVQRTFEVRCTSVLNAQRRPRCLAQEAAMMVCVSDDASAHAVPGRVTRRAFVCCLLHSTTPGHKRQHRRRRTPGPTALGAARSFLGAKVRRTREVQRTSPTGTRRASQRHFVEAAKRVSVHECIECGFPSVQ